MAFPKRPNFSSDLYQQFRGPILLMVFDLQGLLLFYILIYFDVFQTIDMTSGLTQLFYVVLFVSFDSWVLRDSHELLEIFKVEDDEDDLIEVRYFWGWHESHPRKSCGVSAKPKIARKLRRTLKVQQEEVCQFFLGNCLFAADVDVAFFSPPVFFLNLISNRRKTKPVLFF